MDSSKDNEQFGPLLIKAPIIDLKASDTRADRDDIDTDSFETDATHFVPPNAQSAWRHWPLAAGVVVAALVGAIAGAGTTATLRDNNPPATFADATTIHTLQTSVAQLSSELATVKSGIANAQRSSSAQFGKLAERIDRSEKSQEKALAEPAAKLAKIQESIDRLEKRPQQVAAAPASDITGSITPKELKEAKEEPKPVVAQGWQLVDYYDGRAIVENRHGTLFRVGPGGNLPGLGKVASVKRDNGRITVVTTGGIITATLEQPPPRRMLPQYYRW
jgi:hypothetical protein